MPLLSTFIRQIAVRTLSDVIPSNAVEALKQINKRFVFMVIVPRRIFWLPQKIVLFKSIVVKQNNTQKLVFHCIDGEAVKITPTRGFYYIRGRRCSKWAIKVTTPTLKKSIRRFFNLNVEERRMVLERIDIKNVIRDLEAKTIDTKDNYKLIEVQLGTTTKRWNEMGKKPARFLQMKNPSINDHHIEDVDNECNTVDETLRWHNHDSKTLPVPLP